MQTRKICLFLSVVLLAVCVLFFSLYLNARHQSQTLSDTMIADAAAYFTAIGMHTDKDVISRRIPDHAIYTYKTEERSTLARQLAEQLSKAYYDAADVSFLETPDGAVCSVSRENGTGFGFRLYEDAMTFVYADNASETDDAALSYFENEDVPKAEIKKAVAAFASVVLPEGDATGLRITGIAESSDGWLVSTAQTASDSLIKDRWACFVIRDKTVLAVRGCLVFSPYRKAYQEMLTDGINALYQADHTVIDRVLSEEIAYTCRETENGTGYLIPVWKIAYLDREGRNAIQYIDAIRK